MLACNDMDVYYDYMDWAKNWGTDEMNSDDDSLDSKLPDLSSEHSPNGRGNSVVWRSMENFPDLDNQLDCVAQPVAHENRAHNTTHFGVKDVGSTQHNSQKVGHRKFRKSKSLDLNS
ncbi:hypothetical protein L2E82_18757 [Cichorium intybus]|uniref:Uncharacterized protein n=1 Tax=Cichorium intybus TaxID=13427 RepID=A0ACB9FAD9_CICIN|nr:hypothetical protein L2E82_18757 [Cichorium intybus]